MRALSPHCRAALCGSFGFNLIPKKVFMSYQETLLEIAQKVLTTSQFT
jgi:hypothetical protein